ncbi:MAG: glycosyltransferase [Robiginitalea sp.]|uniref:glycosyltransferase n=1 Tax=Robiginitalea sp. TaxID=1902411 RepID=UPI003C780D6B
MSIVVPTYNVEQYLAICLDSLVNQSISAGDYEIIVVNDGSTDGSGDIAMSYQDRYTQIKVYHQENQGLSAARNKGIELATGTYIYFIDSDDYIAHHTLPYALKVLQSNNLEVFGLKVKYTDAVNDWQSGNFEVTKTESVRVMDGITYLAEHNYLNTVWWYIIKRKYLMESGLVFPVGRFMEDAVFTAKLLANTNRIAESSLEFYRYRVRPNSITTQRDKQHNLKLINDYEINATEFGHMIRSLSQLSHPNLPLALERLSAMQHSFVFFMLVKCIKFKLTQKKVEPILDRLSAIDGYPINEVFIRQNPNAAYRLMRLMMNHKSLYFAALNTLGWIHKIFPNIYNGMDKLVNALSKIRGRTARP